MPTTITMAPRSAQASPVSTSTAALSSVQKSIAPSFDTLPSSVQHYILSGINLRDKLTAMAPTSQAVNRLIRLTPSAYVHDHMALSARLIQSFTAGEIPFAVPFVGAVTLPLTSTAALPFSIAHFASCRRLHIKSTVADDMSLQTRRKSSAPNSPTPTPTPTSRDRTALLSFISDASLHALPSFRTLIFDCAVNEKMLNVIAAASATTLTSLDLTNAVYDTANNVPLNNSNSIVNSPTAKAKADSDGFHAILTRFVSLRHLSLPLQLADTDTVCKSLRALPALESLVAAQSLTSVGIIALCQIHTLTTLDLTHVIQLYAFDLTALSHCRRLRTLHLPRVLKGPILLPPTVFAVLSKCTRLTSLDCCFLDHHEASQATLSPLTDLVRLQSLQLTGRRLHDTLMTSLLSGAHGWRSLQTVDLSRSMLTDVTHRHADRLCSIITCPRTQLLRLIKSRKHLSFKQYSNIISAINEPL